MSNSEYSRLVSSLYMSIYDSSSLYSDDGTTLKYKDRYNYDDVVVTEDDFHEYLWRAYDCKELLEFQFTSDYDWSSLYNYIESLLRRYIDKSVFDSDKCFSVVYETHYRLDIYKNCSELTNGFTEGTVIKTADEKVYKLGRYVLQYDSYYLLLCIENIWSMDNDNETASNLIGAKAKLRPYSKDNTYKFLLEFLKYPVSVEVYPVPEKVLKSKPNTYPIEIILNSGSTTIDDLLFDSCVLNVSQLRRFVTRYINDNLDYADVSEYEDAGEVKENVIDSVDLYNKLSNHMTCMGLNSQSDVLREMVSILQKTETTNEIYSYLLENTDGTTDTQEDTKSLEYKDVQETDNIPEDAKLLTAEEYSRMYQTLKINPNEIGFYMSTSPISKSDKELTLEEWERMCDEIGGLPSLYGFTCTDERAN